MSRLHPDLVSMADSVDILGHSRYRILGREREVTVSPTNIQDQQPLLTQLADDLYERVFIRPSDPDGPSAADWLVNRDFLASLSAANTGQGPWESGWRVRRLEGEKRVVLGPHGLELWASLADVRSENGHLAPGDLCRIRLAKELRSLSLGYYFALGDHDEVGDGQPDDSWDHQSRELQLRYYWHLTSAVAARFVGTATSILNTAAVPFRLKVLRYPGAYFRADAGVLYVRHCHARGLGRLIGLIYQEIKSGLRSPVPMLTRRLFDGLSLAVEAKSAGSFGQQRCRIVARALWEAFQQGEADRSSRLERLAEGWSGSGLNREHPYLGRVATAEMLEDALPETSCSAVKPRFGLTEQSTGPVRPAAIAIRSTLDAAVRIGRVLCDRAYWDRDGQLCNWVGRSSLERQPDGRIEPVSAALGADLYAGSAGIALFLAQLHAITGDEVSRRTALGAIARSVHFALNRPERLRPSISLFEGRLGVAFAAWSAGRLLSEPELTEQAATILNKIRVDLSEPHPLDLIGGNAGAVLALLKMSEAPASSPPRDSRELSLATELGEELCDQATRRDGVCSWAPEIASGPGVASAPLGGMSHGVSGIAVALLELHARTARHQFLETARGAFAYEDSLFCPPERNWRDLRLIGTSRVESGSERFGRTWCHGAPGISLARLRAMTLDPENSESHRDAVRTALATTLSRIDELVDRRRHDASLCHGLAGLLEVALIAGRRLGVPASLDRARTIARALIERHDTEVDYPSGLGSGAVNPSLMLGLAGTGYAFLRLHAPDRVPSMLLLSEGRVDAACSFDTSR
jgi:hypothetical protein